jgi:hypothetical protein
VAPVTIKTYRREKRGREMEAEEGVDWTREWKPISLSDAKDNMAKGD